MQNLNRREFARLTGAALVAGLAVRSLPGFAQGEGDPRLAALDHIDPELRPAARQVLASSGQTGSFDEATLQAMRAGTPPSPPLLADVPTARVRVPAQGSLSEVTVYTVNARPGERKPAILHTHGGGFILGSAALELRYLQETAVALDCAIVTVEYRLAPETRFTGSVEDNYAGLLWLYRNAEALGVDRKRIALLGESAGGGHAALLAIAARDRGEVPLVLQALIYPMLDDRTGSSREVPPHIGVIGWDAPANRFGWKSFLGMEPGGADVPTAGVPARLRELKGLAPAYVAVGGVDLFVGENIEYARRLTEAGVPAEMLLVPGAFHGFDRVAPGTAPAKLFTDTKHKALRRAFAMEPIA
ncbi:MAG: alpha/beta hydrolase fold domain-containing protein [Candidatus Andeanibacterium colombiense]|uniref:Alpha/beta hydrolase fold domain-containing protein n=1 Tax=Candidatus Andeanibacterium colombiense TaxID=3121345 RepID=A0AAJ5X648_9SPHN|nr:MAG: alpha/beta hydrolase fold domain-containing protein [Sphingomonadaceae bacterium]